MQKIKFLWTCFKQLVPNISFSKFPYFQVAGKDTNTHTHIHSFLHCLEDKCLRLTFFSSLWQIFQVLKQAIENFFLSLILSPSSDRLSRQTQSLEGPFCHCEPNNFKILPFPLRKCFINETLFVLNFALAWSMRDIKFDASPSS